jgi:hypothetical protein
VGTEADRVLAKDCAERPRREHTHRTTIGKGETGETWCVDCTALKAAHARGVAEGKRICRLEEAAGRGTYQAGKSDGIAEGRRQMAEECVAMLEEHAATLAAKIEDALNGRNPGAVLDSSPTIVSTWLNAATRIRALVTK